MLKVKASVVYDENGSPQKIIGVDKDITHIKNAEEQLEKSQYWLEQTTKASPDAITVYDLKHKRPIYLNDCLAKWTGFSVDDLINIGIEGRLQLVHPDDRLRLLHFNEMVATAKDGQVLTMEYRIKNGEGNMRWVRNRSKIFQRDESGRVTHLLSILQDISEEKTAEEKLKELNVSLEAKNKDLENKNDEITSFAFVASHDLREPLRKIHTFSDWLLTQEKGISETGRQHLQRMARAVKRIDQLIDDVLALAKVQVDRESLRRVDLNELFKRLREELKEKLEKTEAVLEAESLPTVTGVENQLYYLFKNLLDNALTFQAKDNQPHVRIEAVIENDFAKISVADNGIGIAKEHHKKIFEMFRRLHSRADYAGTGMGLAICKKIMEKHGGKITVESTEGSGTSFTCWFPL